MQMLTFLKARAELQLSNEQKEKKLTLAEQEKALKQSELEKQTLISKQKEQALEVLVDLLGKLAQCNRSTYLTVEEVDLV